MAGNPLGFDPRGSASVMNPLYSPYWGTNGSMGGANGRGVFNWEQLAPLGYDVSMFAETPMEGDVSPAAINPQATADWLAQNGLQLMEQPGPNGETFRYVVDGSGNVVGNAIDMTTNDSAFWNAAMLAAGVTGANIYAAGAGTGAAATGANAAATGAPSAAGGGNALLGGSTTGGYGGLTGGGLLTGGAVPASGGLTVAGAGGGAGLAGAGAGAGGLSIAGAGGAGGASFVTPGLGSSIGAGTGASMSGSAGWGGLSPNTWANLGQTAIGLIGQNQGINAMQDATAQSNELARYVYDTNRADNKPLVDLRNSVLPQIQGLLSNPGSITNDPGYQFQLQEGMRARQNSAAGAGMTYSGAQQKALTRYGTDFASTKLNDSLNRLTSVAGLGQVGSNNNQQAANQYGNTVGGNALNYGGARAGAYIGGANMAGNALGSIFNNWQDRQLNGGS